MTQIHMSKLKLWWLNLGNTMCKNFKFILEIKFSSSKQFNNVVTEHSILNEKEVTFVRHDAKKVKMECTLKCNF